MMKNRLQRTCCAIYDRLCQCCRTKEDNQLNLTDVHSNTSQPMGGNAAGTTATETLDDPGQVYTALYDYKHKNESLDFSFQKGDCFVVLNRLTKQWWLVRWSTHCKEGYAPSNYLVKLTSIQNQKWYVGNITIEESEKMLKFEKDGTFLVRDSNSRPGSFSLSVRWHSAIKQYNILQSAQESGFHLVDPNAVFPSIETLIEHHYNGKVDIGNGVQLRHVYKQKEAPPTPLITLLENLETYETVRASLQFNKVIGSGFHAEVWQGLLNGYPVAIKTLRQDAMEVADFVKEAEILVKLNHKRLVRLYGLCSKQQPIYIITEFVKYGSLLNYFENNKCNVTVSDIIQMVYQVLEGMTYLESKKYVHRDLAARNVLVGEGLQIKICDFGLACLVKMNNSATNQRLKVPIRWTAPEVFPSGTHTIKSDVWSFGILLYEMFTYGEKPYGDSTNQEIQNKVNSGYRLPKPLECPDDVYQIMDKTWAADPEERPHFHQLLVEFESFVQSNDIGSPFFAKDLNPFI